jgi:hypothetical protein
VNGRYGLLVPLALCLAGVSAAQAPAGPRFSGDFRVRYERTTEGNGTLAFDREVVRFRIGMSYAPREDLMIRARLATGDPDDPNSTDITLDSFNDDLAVSLDAASVEVNRPRWGVIAGKFYNPLQYTELVWDGDVNPQGVAARVLLGDKASVNGTLTGIYSIVAQQSGDSSSDMTGGQLTVAAPVGGKWKVSGSAAYYDYRIRSLSEADGGDWRSNRRNPAGTAFVSDFNLLDLLVTLDYSGFGERYPLRLVGDYVNNSGADDLNTGWEVDVYLGRSARQGDLRYRYGYGTTETDAVLAAFSHDNTTLGTNYDIHTLSVDAVPIAGLFLNATYYYYRPHEAVAQDYQHRLRLNAMVTF